MLMKFVFFIQHNSKWAYFIWKIIGGCYELNVIVHYHSNNKKKCTLENENPIKITKSINLNSNFLIHQKTKAPGNEDIKKE